MNAYEVLLIHLNKIVIKYFNENSNILMRLINKHYKQSYEQNHN